MKRFHHILRITLILAVAMAPLGGAYAGIAAKAGAGSHCAKMDAKMKMDHGNFCKHHDNADDSGLNCENNCNDCKVAHHVASLANCPMHDGKMDSHHSNGAGKEPHSCPYHNTGQPPKH